MLIKKVDFVGLSQIEQLALYNLASVECGRITCAECPLGVNYNDRILCIRNLCRQARSNYYSNSFQRSDK